MRIAPIGCAKMDEMDRMDDMDSMDIMDGVMTETKLFSFVVHSVHIVP